jgi:predicted ribosomally synthesized peptide with SipW-like signal peptide
MKKILISLSIIGVVGAIAIGGTMAYFSDTETSTGNTFTAGTLDLVVTTSGTGPAGKTTVNENGDGFNDNVVFANLAPGDSGSIVWTITNNGSLDGFIDVHQWLTNDSDGVDTEPELLVDPTPGGVGELDNEMVLTSSLTIDGLNVGFLPQPWVGKWSDIAVYGPAVDLLPVPLPVGKSLVMTYAWDIPITVGNTIQGDTFTADFQMFLDQTNTP